MSLSYVLFKSRKFKWILNGFLLATISFLLASCSTGGYGLFLTHDIRVVIAGNGSVEVTKRIETLGESDPDAEIFNCLASDSPCDYDTSFVYPEYLLKPKADDGWKFVGWTNKDSYCQGEAGTCVVASTRKDDDIDRRALGFGERRVYTATFEEINTKPTIVSFKASPESIESGESFTLSWTVTGSQPIEVSVSGLGEQTGSSVSVSPTFTTTYTLTAKNSAGTVSTNVTVGVTAPPLPPVMNACEKLVASLNDNNLLQVDMITSTNFVDPDGHLEFIFDVDPAQVKTSVEAGLKSMVLTFSRFSTDVTSSFDTPYINTTGSTQVAGEACKITTKSTGIVAETPATEVVLEGSISSDGATMTGSYSFGTNGTLPDGKPAEIVFELKLKKVSLG